MGVGSVGTRAWVFLLTGPGDDDVLVMQAKQAQASVIEHALARSHARSGDRFAIAEYLRKGRALDAAPADFAVAYADRNERDHALLAAAADAGRIGVQREDR